MGGLGVPAAVCLASAGVGRIGVVDDDVVELSNLPRQPLFRESDAGLKKARLAEERLGEMNPDVEVVAYQTRLSRHNAMGIIGEYEVVLDATDNLPSRYLISDACALQGKPDVYASVLGFEGHASVFFAPAGPCYRCLSPIPPPPGSTLPCSEAGVLSALPGVLGAIQAAQTLELLMGLGDPLIGRLLVFDGMRMSFEEVRIKKDASCPVCAPGRRFKELIDYEEFCGTKPKNVVEEITPSELKQSIDRGQGILLVDVREPGEYSTCHLEGARLIPFAQLPDRLGELDRTGQVVVYCHTGVRSAYAAVYLNSKGFPNVRNLKGGIDAWASEVDRSMARY